MEHIDDAFPPSGFYPLRDDDSVLLPAASFLTHDPRCNGWTAARQSAFLMHLADHGVVADAARTVGMSLAGAYALRRKARGYAFNLAWEAALLIARRIVSDQLMAAAIQGEVARWVRVDGVTTYTRQNAKLSLTLLDRVTPAEAFPEVLAVIANFDWFVQLVEDQASPTEFWQMFFDGALPHRETTARDRVRAGLQLADDSADFEEADVADAPVEYKSTDGRGSHGLPQSSNRHAGLVPGSSCVPVSDADGGPQPLTLDQVRGDGGVYAAMRDNARLVPEAALLTPAAASRICRYRSFSSSTDHPKGVAAACGPAGPGGIVGRPCGSSRCHKVRAAVPVPPPAICRVARTMRFC